MAVGAANCPSVGEIAVAALDVGMLGTLDLGPSAVCEVAKVGVEATRSLGVMVPALVPAVLGPFRDCPRPEGPSLAKKGCVICPVVPALELCIPTPHELFYCAAKMSV